MRRLALALPVVLAACVNGTVPQTSFPPIGSSASNYANAPAAPYAQPAVGNRGANAINVNGKKVNTDPTLRVVSEATRKSINIHGLRQAAERSFGHGTKRDDQIIKVGETDMRLRVVKSKSRGVIYTFGVVRSMSAGRAIIWRRVVHEDRTAEVYDAVRRATGCAGSNNGWTRKWTDGRPNEYTVHLVCN